MNLKHRKVSWVLTNGAGLNYRITGVLEKVVLVNQGPEWLEVQSMGQRTIKVMSQEGVGAIITLSVVDYTEAFSEDCDLCLQVSDNEWLAPLGDFQTHSPLKEFGLNNHTLAVHKSKVDALAYIMEQKLKEAG